MTQFKVQDLVVVTDEVGLPKGSVVYKVDAVHAGAWHGMDKLELMDEHGDLFGVAASQVRKV